METKRKEIPLFIMESELSTFLYHHPNYKYLVQVFYKDKSVAGLLAYKNNPNN